MKQLVLIIAFTTSLIAYPNTLKPVGQYQIKTGDIIEVEIDSDLEQDELRKFTLKKVTDIFYVMEYLEKQQKFKVFVTPLSKKEKLNDAYPFKMEGFEHTNIDGQKDFISLSRGEYKLKESKLNIIIASTLLLVIFIVVITMLIKKRKNNIKNIIERQAKIRQLVTKKHTRESLEEIYALRIEIQELFDMNRSKFNEILEKIDSIQYAPQVDEHEIVEIGKRVNKIEMRDKK